MLASSLSEAVTSPQVTVAKVFPSSAKTLCADGQVSPNEGASLSANRIAILDLIAHHLTCSY